MIAETILHYLPEVDSPWADKIIDPAERDGEGGPVSPKLCILKKDIL